MPLFDKFLKSDLRNTIDLRKIADKDYLIKIDRNSVLESFKHFLTEEGFDGRDGELLYNKVERLLDIYKLEE